MNVFSALSEKHVFVPAIGLSPGPGLIMEEVMMRKLVNKGNCIKFIRNSIVKQDPF